MTTFVVFCPALLQVVVRLDAKMPAADGRLPIESSVAWSDVRYSTQIQSGNAELCDLLCPAMLLDIEREETRLCSIKGCSTANAADLCSVTLSEAFLARPVWLWLASSGLFWDILFSRLSSLCLTERWAVARCRSELWKWYGILRCWIQVKDLLLYVYRGCVRDVAVSKCKL